MKKLIIGRNNACDIIVPDTSDLVSRKHAVLTVSFLGKMVIYDTSPNGTYVNGQRLENGKGVAVKRGDKVSFAHVAELDWSQVHDPYRRTKLLIVLGAVLLALVGGGLAWWLSRPEPAPTEAAAERGATETTIADQPEAQPAAPEAEPAKPKARRKKSARKLETTNTDDVLNKDVNNKSPLVY